MKNTRSDGLDGDGFRFVYMNQDGSVREVSPVERAELSAEYAGADSGRPYIKNAVGDRDGWGSVSGYIARAALPGGIAVLPVHDDFDVRVKEFGFDPLDAHRAAGDIIEVRPDGAVSCTPNPDVSAEERLERMRDWQLAHQRARERLAAVEQSSRDAT
jgi:hypothetical protein